MLMINDWGLVDHDSIPSSVKECETAKESVLQGRKNIGYKQHTIPLCHDVVKISQSDVLQVPNCYL